VFALAPLQHANPVILMMMMMMMCMINGKWMFTKDMCLLKQIQRIVIVHINVDYHLLHLVYFVLLLTPGELRSFVFVGMFIGSLVYLFVC